MESLSERRTTEIESLARQTGFTPSAVEAMRRAMVDGGGRMAQFDHPEFGGSGQWMHGGLLMIPDFSDTALKDRIARLCAGLSAAVTGDPPPGDARQFQRQSAGEATLPARSDRTWYPEALGTPDTSGAQNGARYAWFGDARRLAVDDGGTVTIYDTGDHRIGGVSQQQGADRTVSFVSQHGAVDVSRLPVVDDVDKPSRRTTDDRRGATPQAAADGPGDPFIALEKLAGLHARGIVDDADFAAKKAELLRRI